MVPGDTLSVTAIFEYQYEDEKEIKRGGAQVPTYDYVCEACGHELEAFQRISEKPLRKCPECGKFKLKRLIGAGAGLIFKGSGFYITDYRSDDYKSKAEADKKAASPSDSAGGKDSGSKSEGGADKGKSEGKKSEKKSESKPSKPKDKK